ncbi:MAG: hypothetical protein BGO33_13490 [Bacteroidia bacterium 43-41]|nr:MAG: hypothetical protein BGO33_13490 [Bacteroidia bacterium 43-41]
MFCKGNEFLRITIVLVICFNSFSLLATYNIIDFNITHEIEVRSQLNFFPVIIVRIGAVSTQTGEILLIPI